MTPEAKRTHKSGPETPLVTPEALAMLLAPRDPEADLEGLDWDAVLAD